MTEDLDVIGEVLHRLCSRIGSVFPGWAAADAVTCPDPSESLIAEAYVEVRRFEFVAGRAAAHSALARAGHDTAPVLADSDGVPLFPLGTVGSIAHKHGYGVAVVGLTATWQGVGIDLEHDETDEDEDALVDRVARTTERPLLELLRSAGVSSPGTWLLSAKEASYKALFPTTREDFDFHDVQLVLDPQQPVFFVESVLGTPRAVWGTYGLSHGWLISVAVAGKPV